MYDSKSIFPPFYAPKVFLYPVHSYKIWSIFCWVYRPLKVMGLGLDVVQCGKTLKAYAQRSAWTSAVELLFHLEVC